MKISISTDMRYYNVSQKRSSFYFWNNSVKNEQILIIFGTLNFEGTGHQKVVRLPTSPTYCSYCVWGMSKSHFYEDYSYACLIVWIVIVDEAIDQWRKRLGACVHARVVTLNTLQHCCHIFCHTKPVFSEPPTFFEETTYFRTYELLQFLQDIA